MVHQTLVAQFRIEVCSLIGGQFTHFMSMYSVAAKTSDVPIVTRVQPLFSREGVH